MQIPYNCQHKLGLVIQRSSVYDAQYLVADVLIGLLAMYIVYVMIFPYLLRHLSLLSYPLPISRLVLQNVEKNVFGFRLHKVLKTCGIKLIA